MSNQSVDGVSDGGEARRGALPRCVTFMQRFGLRYPIAQAPVGSTAGPELVAAVSAAGGLGALAATWLSAADAASAVQTIRARAPEGTFQVNFALMRQAEGLDAVLAAGAPIITFSWGRVGRLVPRVHAAGAKVGVQVASLEGAREALDAGADFLICQGVEAGGHVQASRPLRDVLRDVLAEVPQAPQVVEDGRTEDAAVPVLAAGGIGNGCGIAQVLRWGAAGAVLGTRFVATAESRAHPEYKRAIVRASADESVLTVCFDGDWPYAAHRVLRNSTLRAWEGAGSPPRGDRPGEHDVVARRPDGRALERYDDAAPLGSMSGDVTSMALYAGTSCGDVLDVPSVDVLLPRLWGECLAVL